MIRARLASVGIDLDQLPPGSQPDPETGSPGQDAVLASLRRFVRGSVADIATWAPPVPAGVTGPADLLQQQAAVPLLYPATATAWRSA
nr:hypothetical protein [Propioniciclava soli]